jgi:hypothetical protein
MVDVNSLKYCFTFEIKGVRNHGITNMCYELAAIIILLASQ